MDTFIHIVVYLLNIGMNRKQIMARDMQGGKYFINLKRREKKYELLIFLLS